MDARFTSDKQMERAPLLIASGLKRSFGGVVAVADVSIAVKAGEIVGLIGPNGSGKSTFLNLLTGTILTDSGCITLQGVDITRDAPYRRVRQGMSRLFQHSRVFPSLTLQENFRVLMGGVGDTDVLQLLGKVGLVTRVEDLAGDLSYGQQRLLEFTRVLALKPQIVLLDEPTAGVHPKIVERMKELISDLRDEGVAVVIVEHNIEFVTSLADRLVALAEGRIIAEGAPLDVLANSDLISAYFGDGSKTEPARDSG